MNDTPAQPFCILGIDPGISGAIAFYFPDRPDLIGCDDMPEADGEVDAVSLGQRIRQMAPDLAVIERVHAMPKQGVSSTFNFGAAYGTAQGVVLALGVPLLRVTPGAWKKHFRLSSDKEQARAMAIRLWPTSTHFTRKKDADRAEAALMARFIAETRPAGDRR